MGWFSLIDNNGSCVETECVYNQNFLNMNHIRLWAWPVLPETFKPGDLRNLSVIHGPGGFVSRNCNTVEGCTTHRGLVVKRRRRRPTIGGAGRVCNVLQMNWNWCHTKSIHM